MKKGGHFGAWEEPAALAEDIIQFVTKVRNRNATQEHTKQEEL